ncbi:MAG: glycosyl hydrolase family 28-related protein [Novosphingobium sp.]
MSIDFLARGLAAQRAPLADLASTTNGKGSEMIGFRQRGGSAVPRSASAKLSERISVADYGAIGDGTDETSKIQAAIDAAYAEGLSSVYFPFTEGKYRLSKNLVVRPGVSLLGDARRPLLSNLSGAGFGTGGIFLTGNFHPDFTEDLRVHDCGIIPVGNSVTLSIAGDADNFTVGDQVVTYSNERAIMGGFNIPTYMHLNVIEAISGSTVVLRYPIEVAYAGGLARLAEITTTGRGHVIPLFFAENCTIENFRIECERHWQDDTATYGVLYRNLDVFSRTGIYGNTFQHTMFDKCSFRNWRAFSEMSHNSMFSGSRNCTFHQADVTAAGNVLAGDNQFYEGFGIQEFARSIRHQSVQILMATEGKGALLNFRNCKDSSVSGQVHIPNAGVVGDLIFDVPSSGGENSFPRTGNSAELSVTGASVDRYFKGDATGTANTYGGFNLRGNFFCSSISEAVLLNNYNSAIISNCHFANGQISLSGTSKNNTISDSFIGDGFLTSNGNGANEDPLRLNQLARNRTTRERSRSGGFRDSVTTINTASGTKSDVYVGNIGTAAAQRDAYKFEMIIGSNGTSAARNVRVYIRNVTDSADVSLFTHTIAATSSGQLAIKGSVYFTTDIVWDFGVRGVSSGDYVGVASKPAASKELELRVEGDCLGGGNTSLTWRKIRVRQENPYV